MIKLLRDDTRGSALVEFTVTFPFFLLLTFGLIQAGLLLWTLAGLQHGVEAAARCASVNYSAYQMGLDRSCFTDPVSLAPTPSTVIADATNAYIKQYALDQSFGLVQFSTFSVVGTLPTPGLCPTNIGYAVTATATSRVNLMNYLFSPTLTVRSTFPINCS